MLYLRWLIVRVAAYLTGNSWMIPPWEAIQMMRDKRRRPVALFILRIDTRLRGKPPL